MWWPSLLKYLHETGLPSQLVSLLKSYLEDRHIEYYSITEKVGKQLTKGCPQGSALGPLLWNLTVEPLLRHDWPGHVAVTVYADDISIAINANSRVELEGTIQQTPNILSENRNPTVRYRGSPIRRVDSTKYLGVVLDERLSFTKNVEHIASKGRNIFQALRKYANQNWGKCKDSMMRIYEVAIVPIVGYAAEVWIDKAASQNNRRKLRNLQGACLRTVIGAYKTTPCETVCVIAKQPPLELEIRRRLAYSELRRHGRTLLLGEEVRLQDYGFWVAAALQIRAMIVGAWQGLWDISTKGRHCYQLVPDIAAWLDIIHSPISKITCSMLTSHGSFGVHLCRIGKRTTPICQECNEVDSPAHRLMSCKVFEGSRILLEQHLEVIALESPEDTIIRLGPDLEPLKHFVL
ncbi:hypothetical protein JTB14_037828 [Gonioctena quinquepunctata]|nr:hypothetical protein JTB14_037828 [Gonioctena quinquepunctata]